MSLVAQPADVATTAPGIGLVGAAYLLLIGVYLPWKVWRNSLYAANRPFPPRAAYVWSTMLSAAFLGVLALVVAEYEGIELFPAVWPRASDVALGLVALPALYLAMAPYRAGVARRRERRMHLFSEATAPDRARWVLVSLSAGFWEELVYRGVMYTLLLRLTGSAAAALVLTLLPFTLAHLHRGWRAVPHVGGIALVFQALVLVSGSLYVAMGVHALYDAAAGFAYMRLARKLGITRETMSAGGPAPA